MKLLRISGGLIFIVSFLAHSALLAYYLDHRPKIPQQKQGLIAGLKWTHPVRYGTEQDEKRSLWLFNLAFLGFGICIAGELIKIYRLRDYSGIRSRPNPPWDHRWGP